MRTQATSISKRTRGPRSCRTIRSLTAVAAVVAGGLGLVGAVPAASAATPAATIQITDNPAHALRDGAIAQVANPHPTVPAGAAPHLTVVFSHVFTVNVTTDSVDVTPGDGVCLDAAGKCSLRAAIQEADFLNTPVQIVLSAVTYTLSIPPDNTTTPTDDVTSGDLNVTDQGGISIVGSGATVNAAGLGDRLFEVDGGASLSMSSATLTGGTANDASSHSGTLGGALALADSTGSATLDGVTLSGNAASSGGAILNNGALWLTSSTLSGNSAAVDGGGIFNSDGSAQVVNDTISGNTVNSGGLTPTAEGGGVSNTNLGGPVAISGGTISGNTVFVATNGVGNGGAVYANSETTIDGTTIAGNSIGAAPAATNIGGFGGGVFNGYGGESINNSVIDHNTVSPSGTSTGEGGGIYDHAGLVLTNSSVTNNSVTPGSPATNLSAFGGGISIRAGTEQIANSHVDHNSAISSGTRGSEGGGIYNAAGLSVAGSTVSNNTASVQNQSGSGGGAGGGISEEGNNALISNTQIVGNQALGGSAASFNGSGGGIMANDITSVSNSLIASNHADQQGGGMWSDDGQHVTADTFSGNTAQEGGGIWNAWQMEVVNSTISGNATSGTNNDGGGVFDRATSVNSKVVLSSSTVANNTGSVGSGLSVGIGLASPHPSGFVLQNTIIGTNTGSSQCNLTGGTLTSLGHNLASDASCNLVGQGDIPGVDPALLGLANNGGPTPTQALPAASPAIDAGSNTACPPTDQRGISRPQGPACDIGAYEYVAPTALGPTTATTTTATATPAASTSGQSVTYAATVVPTSGTGTPTGTVTFAVGATTLCTTPALVSGSGTCAASNAPVGTDTVVATYSGDAAFLASSGTTTETVTVSPVQTAPQFTADSPPGSATLGSAYSYTFVATGNPTPTYGVSSGSLPAGLLLNATTGMLSGTPTTPGSSTFTITASNGVNPAAVSPPITIVVSSTPPPSGNGYWLVASDGGIFAFGNAGFFGSTGNLHLNRPIVAMAATPDGNGYWLVASDGGIFAFGNAGFFGSTGALTLNQPIVGMAATPDGKGYWLMASDGGIFAFGDAGFFGSTGAMTLNQPIVGMAATPDGKGYWLVASDGGIFAFGNAGFFGSTGAMTLNQPIVGMAATPDGKGYWLVAADGGIFAFGDAGFFGSTGAQHLNQPIVGMAATPDGKGYWLVAADGGIFAFGDSPFFGSTGVLHLNQSIVGMATRS
jgi:CSLREA domain-containing protein